MSKSSSITIVENLYQYFNSLEWENFFSLFSDDIVHQMNSTVEVVGKDKLVEYINVAIAHYEEQISDYVLMASEDGRHIAAKIKVKGKYIKTDETSIPAKGQIYTVSALHYYEIKEGKIIRADCFFDEEDFTNQLMQEVTQAQ